MIKIFGHYITRFNVEYFLFSKVARFKKCRSCFRCRENKYFGGMYALSIKPPKDAKVQCSNACSPDIHGDQYHDACEWWEPRWYWNIRQICGWLKYRVGRWWCENVRMKIGSLRPPMPIMWEDGLNCIGELSPNSVPKCPHCGEMPYSMEQCQFCGQRFKEVMK